MSDFFFLEYWHSSCFGISFFFDILLFARIFLIVPFTNRIFEYLLNWNFKCLLINSHFELNREHISSENHWHYHFILRSLITYTNYIRSKPSQIIFNNFNLCWLYKEFEALLALYILLTFEGIFQKQNSFPYNCLGVDLILFY